MTYEELNDVMRDEAIRLAEKCYDANTVRNSGRTMNFVGTDGACLQFATDNNVGDKWISVEDRVPESMVDVLCWYEYFRFGDYNRMYQTYGIGHYFRDGFWGGEVSNGQRTKVLAWMPLPDPPKGE